MVVVANLRLCTAQPRRGPGERGVYRDGQLGECVGAGGGEDPDWAAATDRARARIPVLVVVAARVTASADRTVLKGHRDG